MSRLALALVAVAGCAADVDATWQLDRDRLVAVRATPPAIVTDEISMLDGLVAHAGAPSDVETPRTVTAAFAPADLFTYVHFQIDHWEVRGPPPAALDAARAELGLPAGAPVPLSLTLRFSDSGGHTLVATKNVWLGISRTNPGLPAATIDGAPAPGPIAFAVGSSHALAIDVDPSWTVRWLASCAELTNADLPVARLRAVTTCDGELAIVLRDSDGGASWQVWPLRTQ